MNDRKRYSVEARERDPLSPLASTTSVWRILPPDPRTGDAPIYGAAGFMGQYIS